MSRGDASPGTDPATEIGRIRTALRERIDATSLRRVAREIGMTPSGLQKVLDSSSPYQRTLHKLRAWHGRYVAEDYSTAQEVALEELLRKLPVPRRARAREQILAILHGESP